MSSEVTLVVAPSAAWARGLLCSGRLRCHSKKGPRLFVRCGTEDRPTRNLTWAQPGAHISVTNTLAILTSSHIYLGPLVRCTPGHLFLFFLRVGSSGQNWMKGRNECRGSRAKDHSWPPLLTPSMLPNCLLVRGLRSCWAGTARSCRLNEAARYVLAQLWRLPGARASA